eukprot:3940384-Rhodomonas_salina.2
MAAVLTTMAVLLTTMAAGIRRDRARAEGTLSFYALPMRCPVLTQPIVLRARYTISGTDIGHHPTRRPVLTQRMSLWQVAERTTAGMTLRCLSIATRCGRTGDRGDRGTTCEPGWGMSYAIFLRTCYAVSGTDVAYASKFSTDLAYGAIFLCTRYAVSGTDLAYGALFLLTCHAVSGTVPTPISLGPCYAVSSTGIGCAAARFLRSVRYSPSVWSYRPVQHPVLRYAYVTIALHHVQLHVSRGCQTLADDEEKGEAVLKVYYGGPSVYNGGDYCVYSGGASLYNGVASFVYHGGVPLFTMAACPLYFAGH